MTQSMIELKVPVPIRTFGATVTIEGELAPSGDTIYPDWNVSDDPLNDSYWGSGVGTREARFMAYIGPSGLPFDSITDDMMSEIVEVDVDYAAPTLGMESIAHPPFTEGFGDSFDLGGVELTLSNLRFDSLVSPTHLVVDYTTSTGILTDQYVRVYAGNLRYWDTFYTSGDPLTGGLYGSFGDIGGPIAPGSGTVELLTGIGLTGTAPHKFDIREYYVCTLHRIASTGANLSGLIDVGDTSALSTRTSFRLKEAIQATAANLQSLYLKYVPSTLPVDGPHGVAIYNVTIDGYVTSLDLGPHSTTASFS